MNEEQQKRERIIKALRLVFTTSCAAFELQDTVIATTGGRPVPSVMKSLHRMAREEIMGENPDMEKIDLLLERMEQEAKGKHYTIVTE
jgi:hypothetical protein